MCGTPSMRNTDFMQIPTGELAAVQGTPFDFSRAQHALLGPAITAIDGGGKPGLGTYVCELASRNSCTVIVCKLQYLCLGTLAVIVSDHASGCHSIVLHARSIILEC
jgi:hypothetical protein